jgi:hypothetical protein
VPARSDAPAWAGCTSRSLPIPARYVGRPRASRRSPSAASGDLPQTGDRPLPWSKRLLPLRRCGSARSGDLLPLRRCLSALVETPSPGPDVSLCPGRNTFSRTGCVPLPWSKRLLPVRMCPSALVETPSPDREMPFCPEQSPDAARTAPSTLRATPDTTRRCGLTYTALLGPAVGAPSETAGDAMASHLRRCGPWCWTTCSYTPAVTWACRALHSAGGARSRTITRRHAERVATSTITLQRTSLPHAAHITRSASCPVLQAVRTPTARTRTSDGIEMASR